MHGWAASTRHMRNALCWKQNVHRRVVSVERQPSIVLCVSPPPSNITACTHLMWSRWQRGGSSYSRYARNRGVRDKGSVKRRVSTKWHLLWRERERYTLPWLSVMLSQCNAACLSYIQSLWGLSGRKLCAVFCFVALCQTNRQNAVHITCVWCSFSTSQALCDV